MVDTACIEHDCAPHSKTVAALAASALTAPAVRAAAAQEHWRETWVGTTREDGTVIEGIVDLLHRDPAGRLRIIDYKTDDVPPDAIATRAGFYRPQLDAYVAAVKAATGADDITATLLFLRSSGPAIAVDL